LLSLAAASPASVERATIVRSASTLECSSLDIKGRAFCKLRVDIPLLEIPRSWYFV